MFPVRRGRDQDQGQALARRGSEFDLVSPLSPFSPSSFLAGSPWQIMRRMQEDMDRLFGQLLGGPMLPAGQTAGGGGGAGALAPFSPSVDISEDEREFRLEMDLPGFRPEDVDIQVLNGHLIVRAEMRQESGQDPQEQQGQQEQQVQGGQQTGQQQRQYHRRERRYGVVQQVLSLPDNVDEQNIQAEFNHGVLSLHLPKQQHLPGQQGRRIPIAGTGAAAQQQQGASSGNATNGTAAGGAGTNSTDAGGSGVDATPGLGGVGSGDPSGISPQAPVVNDEDQQDQTRGSTADKPRRRSKSNA